MSVTACSTNFNIYPVYLSPSDSIEPSEMPSEPVLQQEDPCPQNLKTGKLMFTGEKYVYQIDGEKQIFSSLKECVEHFPKNQVFPFTELDLSELKKLEIETLIHLIHFCPFLRSLNLSGIKSSRLKFVLQAVAHNCPSLQKLELRHCVRVSDPEVALIAKNCIHLRHLDLSYCESLKGEFLESLGKYCHFLEVLAINRKTGSRVGPFFCRQGKGFAEFFQHNPSLTQLYLEGQSNEAFGLRNEEGSFAISLKQILDVCPSLEFLDLVGCDWAGKDLKELGKKCSRLKVLSLGGVQEGVIQAEDLLTMVTEFHSLIGIHLEMEGEEITDRWVQALVHNHPQLTFLSLEGAEKITDASLRCIQEGCKNLVGFGLKHRNTSPSFQQGGKEVSQLSDLSEEGLLQFLQAVGPGLLSLKIENCLSISPHVILKAKESFSCLEFLCFKGCGQKKFGENLGSEVLTVVAQSFSRLQSVELSDCPQLLFTAEALLPWIEKADEESECKEIILSPFKVETPHFDSLLEIFCYRMPQLTTLELNGENFLIPNEVEF